MPMPHSSDWSSIREASMNTDTRGAAPGDTASRDGEGYTQEGHEEADRVHDRARHGSGARIGQKHPYLAIFNAACCAALLARHPGRMLLFF